jgi:hypothetical protein
MRKAKEVERFPSGVSFVQHGQSVPIGGILFGLIVVSFFLSRGHFEVVRYAADFAT